jgi:hypothetical protein
LDVEFELGCEYDIEAWCGLVLENQEFSKEYVSEAGGMVVVMVKANQNVLSNTHC